VRELDVSLSLQKEWAADFARTGALKEAKDMASEAIRLGNLLRSQYKPHEFVSLSLKGDWHARVGRCVRAALVLWFLIVRCTVSCHGHESPALV